MANICKFNFKDFLGRSHDNVDELELFKVLSKIPNPDKENIWLAGGAIRRTLIGDSLDSDFDFFFRNEEYLESFERELKLVGGVDESSNEHNKTYSIFIGEKKIIIQAITIKYYDSIEDVLDSFDFTITQFGYDGETLFCGEYSLWDLARKKLAIHRLTFGTATMRRVIKYTRQGFTACAGMFADILERVVEDPTIIESEIKYID